MDKRKKNIIELTRITIDDYRRSDKLPVKVVVDSVRSMNNIGSIFRTSDAFMVDEIILCGITATPPHPEIHKTALGAEESVAWRYEKSAADSVIEIPQFGTKHSLNVAVSAGLAIWHFIESLKLMR